MLALLLMAATFWPGVTLIGSPTQFSGSKTELAVATGAEPIA